MMILIPFMVLSLQQNFPHAMTAQLSWHVQNYVAISALEWGWKQNEIYIELK